MLIVKANYFNMAVTYVLQCPLPPPSKCDSMDPTDDYYREGKLFKHCSNVKWVAQSSLLGKQLGFSQYFANISSINWVWKHPRSPFKRARLGLHIDTSVLLNGPISGETLKIYSFFHDSPGFCSFVEHEHRHISDIRQRLKKWFYTIIKSPETLRSVDI